MKNTIKHYLIPSIADIFFICIFLILTFVGHHRLLLDCDTGYHIRIGDYILDAMAIPQHDPFSSMVPPVRFVAFEWLSQTIMALVHRLGGLTGIVGFFSFLIAISHYFFFRILQKANGNIVITVFVMVLVILSTSIHWLARPHIISMLFIIVWYYILDLYQYKDKNYLYFLPVLMLLWVNFHGAFLIGGIIGSAFLLGNLIHFFSATEKDKIRFKTKSKKLAGMLVFSFLVSFINPNGIRGVIHPLLAVFDKFIIDNISEFYSPNFHVITVLPFEGVLLVIIIALAVSKYRLNAIEILLLIVFTHFSLYSRRNIPIFAIIMAPILVRLTEQILASRQGKLVDFLETRHKNLSEIDSSARGYLWLVLPVLFVLFVFTTGNFNFHFDEEIKPVDAVEFLKSEAIPGVMFNEYEYGDYIIYSAYPKYHVFIDGRADMYGVEWFRKYAKISTLRPGWKRILEDCRVNFIIYPTDSYLSQFLLTGNQWQLIYSDKVASIFIKNVPENKYFLEKYKDVIPAEIEEKDGTNI